MEKSKYKSFYPTLRQAKTRWSSKNIVAKQGEGPSKVWYDMMKKDARVKLAASVALSKMGSTTKQQKIVHEEIAGDDEHLYHVTHTKHVAKIQKHGLRPMQTSNWVKAGDKERYGSGEVYTFTHKDDAHQWAGRMDWAHHQKLGSGNISILTMKKPKDHQFDVDDNDPLSQAGQKGKWLKTHAPIPAHHIVGVEKYMPKKLGEAEEVKVGSFVKIHKDFRVTNRKPDTSVFKVVGVHPANGEFEIRNKFGQGWHVPSHHLVPHKLDEDKVGKPSPSVNDIAKKHGVPTADVLRQLAKGIDVEKEHTNDESEAAEIARDHMHEFPDYYDRLNKMEKNAKKDMKEGYDPENEILKGRIETHKAVAEKMAKKHGEQSQEAAFHRALVRRWQKELGEDTLKEEVANSVGGGMSPTIGGEGNIHGFDPIMGKPVRRKKFAGKQVFVVDPTTYHKAYLGKRKYEHYDKYLEGSPFAEEIREYGRKNWNEPIIIENEQTGAMVYLKYGSK